MSPSVTPETVWSSWTLDPTLTLALVLGCSVYALGLERLWRTQRGRGVGTGNVLAFTAGIALVLVAVGSPLEALASELLSAHMIQHLVLVLGAAPLLAAGRPQVVVPAALPLAGRRRLQRVRRRARGERRASAVSRSTILLAAAHILGLWIWHAPPLYGLALTDDGVHVLEHVVFAGTALGVWIALLNPDRRSRLGHGTAVLSVGVILVAGGLLGALLTFAGTPLYPHYSETAVWGLTQLEDQQVAGVLMWVPSAVFYGIVAATLLGRWLTFVESWTRTRERESVRPEAARAEPNRRPSWKSG